MCELEADGLIVRENAKIFKSFGSEYSGSEKFTTKGGSLVTQPVGSFLLDSCLSIRYIE
jgi:hypothetical protein